MSIYYQDDYVTLYHGDALNVLETMDSGSVDCIVTSPPYFGLRDYGVDGQIGAETSPAEFVETLRAVFAEARRVLADDGTLWLNLGDSYASKTKGSGGMGKSGLMKDGRSESQRIITADRSNAAAKGTVRRIDPGVPDKNLLGIPWRVAFALQDDGWILRNDIIWHKPNAMPESVTDRLSTRHEHMFMFSKSRRYWFDIDPIREPHEWTQRRITPPRQAVSGVDAGRVRNRPDLYDERLAVEAGPAGHELGKNPGDVWTIATQPFPGAHFATFPPALPERAIQAGCKPAGKRCDCDEQVHTPTGVGAGTDTTMTTGRGGMNRPRNQGGGRRVITRRVQRAHAEQIRTSPHRDQIAELAGPAFAHYIRTDRSGARPLPPDLHTDLLARGWITDPQGPCDHPVQGPGVVLDPFSGSGTTGLAAAKHGHKYVGIDLNHEYLDLSLRTRLQQPGLDLGSVS